MQRRQLYTAKTALMKEELKKNYRYKRLLFNHPTIFWKIDQENTRHFKNHSIECAALLAEQQRLLLDLANG